MDVATLAVPMLRPLRALRVVVALNVLGRRGRTFARGWVVVYVAMAVAIVGFVASLAVLDAEGASPEANIRTFGDALWWAATTVTTVGNGDRFPTTTEGRIVAVGLMVTGIALVGVVTATLASWFVEKVAEFRPPSSAPRRRSPTSPLRCELFAASSRRSAETAERSPRPACGPSRVRGAALRRRLNPGGRCPLP